MWPQVFNLRFVIAILIAVACCVGVVLLGKALNRGAPKQISSPAELFTKPIDNTFTVLGIAIPALGGLLAFLYSSYPTGRYSLLFASLLICIFVLLLAVWLSFSIWRVASETGTLILQTDRDYKYLAVRILMYFGLMLALGYFVAFCLMELEPLKKTESAEKLASLRVHLAQSDAHVTSLQHMVALLKERNVTLEYALSHPPSCPDGSDCIVFLTAPGICVNTEIDRRRSAPLRTETRSYSGCQAAETSSPKP